MAIKVLTLNTWGLHYVAKKVRERITHIAEELHSYDIVGLQEVWSHDDFDYLVDRVGADLKYSFRAKSGIIGSGLCVFSRYPIISVHFQQFAVSSSMREFASGDLFAGKGILCCRIMTPTGPVMFATTHTNGRVGASQIYEMTKLIANHRGTDPVIVCGDFNITDNSPTYKLLTDYLGLKDSFAGCSVNTVNLSCNCYTRTVEGPKRIDYVFYSSDTSPTTILDVQSKGLALSGNIPGKNFPCSDHEGLQVVFTMRQRDPTVEPLPPRSTEISAGCIQVLEEVVQRIYNRKKKFTAAHSHRRAFFIAALLLGVLLMVAIVFGNHPVMTFIGKYSLGYFLILLVGLLGVWLMWAWLIPVFNINHVNGMETHIEELKTLISYHKSQKAY